MRTSLHSPTLHRHTTQLYIIHVYPRTLIITKHGKSYAKDVQICQIRIYFMCVFTCASKLSAFHPSIIVIDISPSQRRRLRTQCNNFNYMPIPGTIIIIIIIRHTALAIHIDKTCTFSYYTQHHHQHHHHRVVGRVSASPQSNNLTGSL